MNRQQTEKPNKTVKIYFSASLKAVQNGIGPSGTAAILQYVKPCGGLATKLIEAGHPLLTAPQAQMTAAIEGLLTLKQEGLAITLVGNSADVEGWVTGKYLFGSKTKNKGLVSQLVSLIGEHSVVFQRPSADDEKFLLCKRFAGQMADEQQKKRFAGIAKQIQLGASRQPRLAMGV